MSGMHRISGFFRALSAVCACYLVCVTHEGAGADGVNIKEPSGENFFAYLSTSEDFKPVRMERKYPTRKWDRWLFIIQDCELTEEQAAEMKKAEFIAHAVQEADARKIGILKKAGILFCATRIAGPGNLRLQKHHSASKVRAQLKRPVCLVNKQTRKAMAQTIRKTVKHFKSSSGRIAYSLGEGISWSWSAAPCKWDNSPESIKDFGRWLIRRYGSRENVLAQWGEHNAKFMKRMANLDDLQEFYRKNFKEWNLSPWMDAVSYMDSQFCNVVGELTALTNGFDPETRCGFSGARVPAAYGGFNYVKIMPKVQFLGTYDTGWGMEIIRSLNPHNIPVVQASDTLGAGSMQSLWFCLAHGSRGAVRRMEERREKGGEPEFKMQELRQLAAVSKKTCNAHWLHDGVAVYYSHPSVQISFFIDCESHGKTWIHREGSMNSRLCTMTAAHLAWTKLLEDSNLQYKYISYRDIVLRGIDPKEYPVLVMPAVFGMSNAEAEAIRIYVRNGGTVIADHQTGLFDHHGKGRERGAIDDVFGIENRPHAGPGKLFGGKALGEFDPEKYMKGTFLEAATEVRSECRRSRGFPVAERELGTFIENTYSTGRAVLFNVSLAEYLNKRKKNFPEARKTALAVLKYFSRAGIKPRVSITADGNNPNITESVYWKKNGRMYIYIVKNPLRIGPDTCRGKTKDEPVKLRVRFSRPMHDIVDERTGKTYGDTISVTVPWKYSEAAVISCRIETEDRKQ